MSKLKTATSALTAAVLVSGIGFAWAQTAEQQQQEPISATTTTALPSEQTPADPNALQPVDNSTAVQQQSEDASRTATTADSTLNSDARNSTPMSDSTLNNNTAVDNSTSATPSPDASYSEPAPRADRN